jgi:hypothetical protein
MRSEIKDDISFCHLDANIYKELTEEMPRSILGKFTVQIFNHYFFFE